MQHEKICKQFGRAVLALGACVLAGCALCAAGDSPNQVIEDVQWAVSDIDGEALVDGSEVTLKFAPDGRVAGQASCNAYSGDFERSDMQLKISKLIQTKRLCRPASLMQQEQRFTALLAQVERWDIDTQGRLLLQTADGHSVTAQRKAP